MHLILFLINIIVNTSQIIDYINDKILENNYSDKEFSFTQNIFDHQSNDEFNTINIEKDILIDNYSIEEDLNEICEKYLCNTQNNDNEDINIENLYSSINFNDNRNGNTRKTNVLVDNEIDNETQLNNFDISEYYHEFFIIYNNIEQLSRSKEFYFLFKIIEEDLINIITNSTIYFYKDNEFLKYAILKIKHLQNKISNINFFIKLSKYILKLNIKQNISVNLESKVILDTCLRTNYQKNKNFSLRNKH
ncbi:hypothetical protein NAPIS_ORF00024 [Vairimorpha apis BRL 01]|uniref:Uncharacterized protein n=1 Tax=Vairimorpha apis BRL 01 TaxID=1037528 RepID=T0MH06_9MICR|nr:hypothetical protein NAPIS_ORF00024 [Vairimorpha apis BRL 01]